MPALPGTSYMVLQRWLREDVCLKYRFHLGLLRSPGAGTHRAVFLEQGPGDELQQVRQVDQSLVLHAQQMQHFAQFIALNTATLQNGKQSFQLQDVAV